MDVRIVALIVAALAGATMAVQGTLNSALGKAVGLWEMTLIVHVIGAAIAAVLVFLFKMGTLDLAKWATAPWYTYLGGALSLLIIYAVARSIPKIGVAPATTAIVFCQILTAGLIDHFGLFGLQRVSFSWYRAVGVVLMAVGAWLILFRSN
ncbi:DMT family transporter [Desulfofalx alkaliphila]|uniref:DMT family transporter n=1 Tax=Desulfofalx alkaliphila TaxID=105483 RepID=UPI0004E1E632|nr:DMT family transporter [Desulfofalx alkaliphila]